MERLSQRMVCQTVRAPGSKVTRYERSRAGSGASMIRSCRTVPVKYPDEPRRVGDPAGGRISILASNPEGGAILTSPGRVPAAAKVRGGQAVK